MKKNYATVLESYLISALESDTTSTSIGSIIKKYPIKYPKELYNYQFDDNGKFSKDTKSVLEGFFTGTWGSRFNNILSEALELPKHKQRLEAYCNKSGYKLNDFRIRLDSADCYDSRDNALHSTFSINISFYNLDRYEAAGFPQAILPVLNDIVKADMGSQWKVEQIEYATDFTIYRPLNSTETKVLHGVQNRVNEKRQAQKEKAAASKKIRDQKNSERLDREMSENAEKFYTQPLKAQAMEIVKFFTFGIEWYCTDYEVKMNQTICKSFECMKLKPGEKAFKFNYTHPKTFDFRDEKPLNHPLVCYAITNSDSDYKKLEKVYFINYDRAVSKTFRSYIEAKMKAKK